MYKGPAYYVYNALNDNDLDLLQVCYVGEAQILQDGDPLRYNPRTYEGYNHLVVQLMDYRTHQVVLREPWSTPSTKVETVPPTAWKDIYGNDCERDTDWSPSDDEDVQMDTSSAGTNRKRYRTD